MSSIKTFDTVGNEAKGWGQLLFTLAERQRKANADALRLKKEDAQIALDNSFKKAANKRAAEMHQANMDEYNQGQLNNALLQQATDQFRVQYPNGGPDFEQARSILEDWYVSGTPEANRILTNYFKPEQAQANRDLKVDEAERNRAFKERLAAQGAVTKENLAKLFNAGKMKAAIIANGKRGGGKSGISQSDLDGQLAALLSRKKQLQDDLGKYSTDNAYIKNNAAYNAKISSLQAALTRVENDITEVGKLQGRKIGQDDPNNPNNQDDPFGFLTP